MHTLDSVPWRHRLSACALACLALAPVLYTGWRIGLNLRNIAYADEFEVVLEYLTRLSAGLSIREFLEQLFAVQNEHRLLTSRLMMTSHYLLTGTVNFTVIGIIGNLFLLTLCALLLLQAKAAGPRLRLAVVLALVLFQNQHYENFFWGGSSIDHFHIILLAAAAFVALLARTRLGLEGGLLFALLGTFTLAHGLVIWPVGAVLLAADRRFRALAVWCGVAAVAGTGYLTGFFFNPGHHIEAALEFSRVLLYWLVLLGSTPALGNVTVAPWLGAGLMAIVAVLARRRIWERERLTAALVAFCILSLALIAVGRTGMWTDINRPLPSRYGILSAFAWALVAWAWLEDKLARPASARHTLPWAMGALTLFNVCANVHYFGRGRDFADARDAAATRYQHFKTVKGSLFPLFPQPELADRILRESDRHGIYQLPRLPAHRVKVSKLHELALAHYFLDEVQVGTETIYVNGWAFIPKTPVKRGQLHVVFRSDEQFLIYRAVPVRRPDVARVFQSSEARFSGFRLALPVDELPPGEYQVGISFKRGQQTDYIMTGHRLSVPPRADAIVKHAGNY
jgi:hypothetical protein